MTTSTAAPFGRLMTAMITPMTPDGAVDYDGAAKLAAYLVDDMLNEGLVVNGTTGEAPTTTDEEKARLVRVVREAVGDRATVVAGVGTNITAHSVELARQAEKAGAHGLLVVTPYYSKPAQDALAAHFIAIADATHLPALIYDIPSRTGTAVSTETLIRLAEHRRIVGVKDAKGDLAATSQVLARSDLAYYSGDDPMNLPLWSVGAVGCISVTGHVVGDRIHAMLQAFTGRPQRRGRPAAPVHAPGQHRPVPQPGGGHDQGRDGPARPAGRRRPRPAAPSQRRGAAHPERRPDRRRREAAYQRR